MINKPKYYLDKMASNTDVFTEETSDKAGFTFTASTDDSLGLDKMIEIGVYKEFEDEFIRLEHEKMVWIMKKEKATCMPLYVR